MATFWIVVAIAFIVLTAAVVVAVMLPASRSKFIELHATSDETVAIRTPRGRGTATLVLHGDIGRCYEVRTDLRGEGPVVAYVPPALHLVRANLAQRLDALDTPRSV